MRATVGADIVPRVLDRERIARSTRNLLLWLADRAAAPSPAPAPAPAAAPAVAPAPAPDRFIGDDVPYEVAPFPEAGAEAVEARRFWETLPLDPYYWQFQPQTLLLLQMLGAVGADSAFEVGCNVGRNLFWIKRTLGAQVSGVDVNPRAIDKGRRYFGLGEHEIAVGDERAVAALPARSVDVAFTVSVLDHLPRIDETLAEMVRVARKRVILVELVLPRFGVITDARCVRCSYSHDYAAAIARLPARLVSRRPTPLGEGILEHYQTLEIEPVA